MTEQQFPATPDAEAAVPGDASAAPAADASFEATRRMTELAILDAAQIEAGPLCRLALPRRVPFGFHATWAPALAPAEAK